jgi:DNA-3-methyladenine glycosylase
MQRSFPRLQRAFFERSTFAVSRELLGKRLVRIEDGEVISGFITETEAYIGPEDLASHARHGVTDRNSVMWGAPGHAYVYFTYGVHWMLNFVTESDGQAGATLLRGILPNEGIARMRQRRPADPAERVCDGPAKITQALGIDRSLNGHDLCNGLGQLFIEGTMDVPEQLVETGPRVGLNNVPEPWKSKPWRYRVPVKKYSELREILEDAYGIT